MSRSKSARSNARAARKRLITAHHESGHINGAWSLGYALSSISVARTGALLGRRPDPQTPPLLLVERHWDLVTKLAHEVNKRGTMNRQEILEVLEPKPKAKAA
jgi:hypothetical protein